MKRIRVLGEMIWKPLSLRFEELEMRMKNHQENFDREMLVTDQEDLTAHFQAFQEQVRATERLEKEEKRMAQIKEDSRAGMNLASSVCYRSDIFTLQLEG